MSWDDEFDDWHDRTTPESRPGVSWLEPEAAARWRWKVALPRTCLQFALIFLVLALGMHLEKRGRGLDWVPCVGLAAAFVTVLSFVSWLASFSKTRVILSESGIVLGSGNFAYRIHDDEIASAKLVEADGFRVLVIEGESKELLRLYLEGGTEKQAIDCLEQNGVPIERAASVAQGVRWFTGLP
jgi:hypothetical protein